MRIHVDLISRMFLRNISHLIAKSGSKSIRSLQDQKALMILKLHFFEDRIHRRYE